MKEFEFDLGDRVVIEVTGTVVQYQKNIAKGIKYLVRPDDDHLPIVHAHPTMIFPEDDGPEIATAAVDVQKDGYHIRSLHGNVVAFPRPVDEVA